MRRRLLATSLALIAALAGCLAAEEALPAAVPEAGAGPLSRSLPSMAKDAFAVESLLPLPEPLAQPGVATREIAVPAGLSLYHLAIDLDPMLGSAGPAAEATARVLDADGRLVHEMAPATANAKGYFVLEWPEAATYTLEVTAKGRWSVGLVEVTLPADFTPGHFVNVSYPGQTQIDHSFQPKRLVVPAGQPTRFTTFDHDPHAGIENLQHNVHFPKLGLTSEGLTTWGEVRTLDLPALEPGEYEFFCEVHERSLRGTLVVR